MKHFIIAVWLILYAVSAAGADLAPLIKAIAYTESKNNAKAVGKQGELGTLQIHPILVQDVNRILGKKKYSLADRSSHQKSVEMFTIVVNHYSPGESHEVIARRWNGGPKGEQMKSTSAYWAKVKKVLYK